MGAFSILFRKKFNGKFAEPMAPFMIAGCIVYYGVYKLQNALIDTDEWRDDPRNRKRNRALQNHNSDDKA